MLSSPSPSSSPVSASSDDDSGGAREKRSEKRISEPKGGRESAFRRRRGSTPSRPVTVFRSSSSQDGRRNEERGAVASVAAAGRAAYTPGAAVIFHSSSRRSRFFQFCCGDDSVKVNALRAAVSEVQMARNTHNSAQENAEDEDGCWQAGFIIAREVLPDRCSVLWLSVNSVQGSQLMEWNRVLRSHTTADTIPLSDVLLRGEGSNDNNRSSSSSLFSSHCFTVVLTYAENVEMMPAVLRRAPEWRKGQPCSDMERDSLPLSSSFWASSTTAVSVRTNNAMAAPSLHSLPCVSEAILLYTLHTRYSAGYYFTCFYNGVGHGHRLAVSTALLPHSDESHPLSIAALLDSAQACEMMGSFTESTLSHSCTDDDNFATSIINSTAGATTTTTIVCLDALGRGSECCSAHSTRMIACGLLLLYACGGGTLGAQSKSSAEVLGGAAVKMRRLAAAAEWVLRAAQVPLQQASLSFRPSSCTHTGRLLYTLCGAEFFVDRAPPRRMHAAARPLTTTALFLSLLKGAGNTSENGVTFSDALTVVGIDMLHHVTGLCCAVIGLEQLDFVCSSDGAAVVASGCIEELAKCAEGLGLACGANASSTVTLLEKALTTVPWPPTGSTSGKTGIAVLTPSAARLLRDRATSSIWRTLQQYMVSRINVSAKATHSLPGTDKSDIITFDIIKGEEGEDDAHTAASDQSSSPSSYKKGSNARDCGMDECIFREVADAIRGSARVEAVLAEVQADLEDGECRAGRTDMLAFEHALPDRSFLCAKVVTAEQEEKNEEMLSAAIDLAVHQLLGRSTNPILAFAAASDTTPTCMTVAEIMTHVKSSTKDTTAVMRKPQDNKSVHWRSVHVVFCVPVGRAGGSNSSGNKMGKYEEAWVATALRRHSVLPRLASLSAQCHSHFFSLKTAALDYCLPCALAHSYGRRMCAGHHRSTFTVQRESAELYSEITRLAFDCRYADICRLCRQQVAACAGVLVGVSEACASGLALHTMSTAGKDYLTLSASVLFQRVGRGMLSRRGLRTECMTLIARGGIVAAETVLEREAQREGTLHARSAEVASQFRFLASIIECAATKVTGDCLHSVSTVDGELHTLKAAIETLQTGRLAEEALQRDRARQAVQQLEAYEETVRVRQEQRARRAAAVAQDRLTLQRAQEEADAMERKHIEAQLLRQTQRMKEESTRRHARSCSQALRFPFLQSETRGSLVIKEVQGETTTAHHTLSHDWNDTQGLLRTHPRPLRHQRHYDVSGSVRGGHLHSSMMAINATSAAAEEEEESSWKVQRDVLSLWESSIDAESQP